LEASPNSLLLVDLMEHDYSICHMKINIQSSKWSDQLQPDLASAKTVLDVSFILPLTDQERTALDLVFDTRTERQYLTGGH
jgi:hypothetical protein